MGADTRTLDVDAHVGVGTSILDLGEREVTPRRPTRRRRGRWSASSFGWLGLVALAPVAWHVGALMWIFASRLAYPMDIEWMEGGALYHGHRVMYAEPVWGPPEQGFVPFPYPPLHAVVLAGVGQVVSLDYWTGRLVSIAFLAVAAAVLLHQLLRHSDRSVTGRVLAVLGVGTALAAYPVTGGWYDLVRNDTLAIALPLLAAALVADGERLRRARRWVPVAVLLVAAVYTKQTGVFFVAWIVLFALLTDRRTGVRIAGLTAVLAVGLLVALQIHTDGWFLTWMLLMRQAPLETDRIQLAGDVVWDFAPYLVVLPLLALGLGLGGWLSRRSALWLGMLVAAIPASLLPFVKEAGFRNNLLPVVFLAGPVAMIVVGDLLHGLDRARRVRTRALLQGLALAATATLLAVQRYPVDDYIPSGRRWQAAEDFNAYVRHLDGEVLMPEQPWVAVRNGHKVGQLHVMPHYDAAVLADVEGTELEGFVARSEARWLIVGDGPQDDVEDAGWRRVDKSLPRQPETLVGRAVGPTHLYER